MVKQTKPTKKKTGRPPSPPEDLRTERTAMRMHPNMLFELNAAAREAGKNRSLFIEWVLIGWLNNRLMGLGERQLDAIGKYVSDAEMERIHAASERAHAAAYAQRSVEYGAPPVLQHSPVPGGLPRWAPPPPAPKKPGKK
jgi:hypothetical protein